MDRDRDRDGDRDRDREIELEKLHIMHKQIINLYNVQWSTLLKLCKIDFTYVPEISSYITVKIDDIDCRIYLTYEQITKLRHQVYEAKVIETVLNVIPDLDEQIKNWLSKNSGSVYGSLQIFTGKRELVNFEWPSNEVLLGLKIRYPSASFGQYQGKKLLFN